MDWEREIVGATREGRPFDAGCVIWPFGTGGMALPERQRADRSIALFAVKPARTADHSFADAQGRPRSLHLVPGSYARGVDLRGRPFTPPQPVDLIEQTVTNGFHRWHLLVGRHRARSFAGSNSPAHVVTLDALCEELSQLTGWPKRCCRRVAELSAEEADELEGVFGKNGELRTERLS